MLLAIVNDAPGVAEWLETAPEGIELVPLDAAGTDGGDGMRAASPVRLSRQERRVMALYAAGGTVKGVALQLGITDETARSYLKRVREKYRAHGIDVGTKITLRLRAIQDGVLVGAR